jgi:hypothetical protein
MFCTKCGKQVCEEWQYCPKCGEKIIIIDEDNTSSNNGGNIDAEVHGEADEISTDFTGNKDEIKGVFDSKTKKFSRKKKGIFIVSSIVIIAVITFFIWCSILIHPTRDVIGKWRGGNGNEVITFAKNGTYLINNDITKIRQFKIFNVDGNEAFISLDSTVFKINFVDKDHLILKYVDFFQNQIIRLERVK